MEFAVTWDTAKFHVFRIRRGYFPGGSTRQSLGRRETSFKQRVCKLGQYKVYVGDEDLGTPRVTCMVCGQEGQLAQDQDYDIEDLNNPEMILTCCATCMDVKQFEISVRRRYEELLK